MKSTKKSSKAKASGKTARTTAKARKPAASKAKSAKVAKAAAPKAKRAAAPAPKAAPVAAPPKPVNEWAEAIKKAALQNKQGHNSWPGAGSPPWKGKQRPE